MAKCETFEELLKLRDKLSARTNDLAVLSSAPMAALQHANAPQGLENMVALRKLIGRMSVVYVFTLIDESGFRFNKNPWLTEEERDRLRAWRHVRDSASHFSGDARASYFNKQFDAVMTGPNPFNCVNEYDDETLIVASHAGYQLLDEAIRLMNELTTRSSSPGPTA